jgi:hypothetical protein
MLLWYVACLALGLLYLLVCLRQYRFNEQNRAFNLECSCEAEMYMFLQKKEGN